MGFKEAGSTWEELRVRDEAPEFGLVRHSREFSQLQRLLPPGVMGTRRPTALSLPSYPVVPAASTLLLWSDKFPSKMEGREVSGRR